MNLFDLPVPRVLDCRFFRSSSITLEQSKRIVSNYELDFNLSDGRTMTVDGQSYEIEKDSLVFRRPGEFAQSSGTYHMYMLTFDFDDAPREKEYSRNLFPQPPCAIPDVELLRRLPHYAKSAHGGEITEIYRALLSNFRRADAQKEAVCSQLVTKLLYLFAADSLPVASAPETRSKVSEAILYISERYAEPLTLDGIAGAVYLDKSYLTRCFKKELGKTPIAFLNELRLSNAKTMLMETSLSVSDIAGL